MIAYSSQSNHNHHNKTRMLLCDVCTYKKRKMDEREAKVDTSSAEVVTVQGTLSLVVE